MFNFLRKLQVTIKEKKLKEKKSDPINNENIYKIQEIAVVKD